MLNVYFGSFGDGRLKRLQYLGYYLLMLAFIFAIGIVVVLAIGVSEHIVGGNIQEAQDLLREKLSGLALIVVGACYLAIVVAGLNIMAKRIRDIGLNGWWIVLAVIVLAGMTGYFHETESGAMLGCVAFLVLVLVPSNAIGGKA